MSKDTWVQFSAQAPDGGKRMIDMRSSAIDAIQHGIETEPSVLYATRNVFMIDQALATELAQGLTGKGTRH